MAVYEETTLLWSGNAVALVPSNSVNVNTATTVATVEHLWAFARDLLRNGQRIRVSWSNSWVESVPVNPGEKLHKSLIHPAIEHKTLGVFVFDASFPKVDAPIVSDGSPVHVAMVPRVPGDDACFLSKSTQTAFIGNACTWIELLVLLTKCGGRLPRKLRAADTPEELLEYPELGIEYIPSRCVFREEGLQWIHVAVLYDDEPPFQVLRAEQEPSRKRQRSLEADDDESIWFKGIENAGMMIPEE